MENQLLKIVRRVTFVQRKPVRPGMKRRAEVLDNGDSVYVRCLSKHPQLASTIPEGVEAIVVVGSSSEVAEVEQLSLEFEAMGTTLQLVTADGLKMLGREFEQLLCSQLQASLSPALQSVFERIVQFWQQQHNRDTRKVSFPEQVAAFAFFRSNRKVFSYNKADHAQACQVFGDIFKTVFSDEDILEENEYEQHIQAWQNALVFAQDRNQQAGHPLDSTSPKAHRRKLLRLFKQAVHNQHPVLKQVQQIAPAVLSHVQTIYAEQKRKQKQKKTVKKFSLPEWVYTPESPETSDDDMFDRSA